MPIRELFHFMQIVDDFDLATQRYQDLLAPQVYMAKSWSDFDKRWASLAVVGPDFVLEIMEPSKDPGDGDSPLPKFHRRHGQHLHSMAWFVDADDFAGLMDRMKTHDVRVITPYNTGGDEAAARPITTFFTHPKDTFGQLELQSFSGTGSNDPRFTPGWSADFWRKEQPLGIEGMSHLTTIVSDLDRARSFYRDVMDAPVFHEEVGPDRRSAFVLVGTETVVELAQPTSDDSRLGQDLARHGELPHALTFKVSDLDAAERHVRSVDIGIAERSDTTIVVEPADMCNAVIGFTDRRLPGDPRP